MKKTSGFTLIELMVVMAIIAILATAGLSAYTNYIKKARDTTRLSMASQIEVAVTSLMASNGGQAPTDSELIAELDAMNFAWMMTPTPSISLTAISHTLEDVLGISYTYALSDPIGGRSVCLDAAGNADEPCRFNYFLFNDGTYAISYGIESENSRTGNFYVVGTTAGIYRGTAPFIGSAPGVGYVPSTVPTITNGGPTTLDDAVDTGGGGNGGGGGPGQVGDSCNDTSQCAGWCTNNSQCGSTPLFGQCTSDGQCGNGYICSPYNGCTDRQLNSPCADNSYCDSGYCYQASAATHGGFDAYTCTTGEAGVGCYDDTGCQSGLTCVPVPEQFEGGICTGGGGTIPLGEACTTSSECESNYCGGNSWAGRQCTDGLLGSSCEDANTIEACASGYCDGGNCTDGSYGSLCISDQFGCQSGLFCDYNFNNGTCNYY